MKLSTSVPFVIADFYA